MTSLIGETEDAMAGSGQQAASKGTGGESGDGEELISGSTTGYGSGVDITDGLDTQQDADGDGDPSDKD